MTPKQIFLTHPTAVRALLGLVKTPEFDLACMCAKNQWIDERKPDSDKIVAVGQFIDTLKDVARDEIELQGTPAPRLNHDLTVPERTKKTPQKPEKKKL